MKTFRIQKLSVFLFSIIGCVFLVGESVGQSKAGLEFASGADRRRAKDLVRRFRRAKNDSELRAQIADEAIMLGKPAAEMVLQVANKEQIAALNSYGAEFRKLICESEVFTADGVVESNPRLQDARAALARNELVRESLLKSLETSQYQNHSTFSESAASEFKDALKAAEVEAVEDWLSLQGCGSLTSSELFVIQEINRLRNEAGLGALDVDYKLCCAARDHSNDMAVKHFFSHVSPVHGKKTFADRARRFGARAFAENIVKCNKGESPVAMWLNSKPHKKIMFDRRFNTIGVGASANNYTAMFGFEPKPTDGKPGKVSSSAD